MPIHAYAATGPGQELTPFEYEPAPLGPQDVELAISHCGICYQVAIKRVGMSEDGKRNTANPIKTGQRGNSSSILL